MIIGKIAVARSILVSSAMQSGTDVGRFYGQFDQPNRHDTNDHRQKVASNSSGDHEFLMPCTTRSEGVLITEKVGMSLRPMFTEGELEAALEAFSLIALKGKLVTTDALHCSSRTVAEVNKGRGDWCLALSATHDPASFRCQVVLGQCRAQPSVSLPEGDGAWVEGGANGHHGFRRGSGGAL